MALLAALTSGAACSRQAETAAPAHALSVRADVVLPPEIEVFESRVPRHATLDSLLREYKLAPELIRAAVESAASVFNPRHLRADRPYRLVRSLDGWLREFVYEIDADRFLRIVNPDRSRPEVLDADVLLFDKDIAVVAIQGEIDSAHPSLIAATDAIGERVELAMALADIFAGQIDFDSELQPGDGFEVLFEKASRAGEFAGYGNILGARFVADGKQYQAFRWTDPTTGKSAYYDESGRSLKRFFLMSPLKFEPRITSRFSRSRLHPVFHTRRAHLGVDYGARHGAPVVAVAAGTVVSAGWAGGGGKQIRLRHAGGFESYYLHLSSFASGIRRGVHVDQGQFIGRVGATGTATGPHLDFRLRKNGVFVDPVRERRRQPPGRPIPPAHLQAFQEARDGLLRQISTTLVAETPRQRRDALKTLE
jgi:murein DD-endopeptidase MepM/ murein hydrolase activator NlpD